jgi:hypothetical protein
VTGAYRPMNPVLAGAYANTRSAVAYLDETFHRGAPGADRFYVFSSVVVEREEMVNLRAELEAIVCGTFWHTSDELLTEDGRKKASAMLDYLGKGPEVCVISHHVQIADDDEDLEGARRECLRGLAAKLSAGTDPVRERIDLVAGSGVCGLPPDAHSRRRHLVFAGAVGGVLRRSSGMKGRCRAPDTEQPLGAVAVTRGQTSCQKSEGWFLARV